MGTVVWLKKRDGRPETAEPDDAIPAGGAEIVILPCIRYERPERLPHPADAASTSPLRGKNMPHFGSSSREPKAV
ncbi:hypothetical protein [Jiella avicenniae]|uniref:Uncharacterized protein n=1 Tax=Jiella avicenniae TaxID=2907202 RepID=A0A9X1TA91_9HYPH|nr:hypothetical protein [Jiella avicenniae]MCE7027013.1 hypothetical protein [Jiella avicenniae]